MTRVEKYVRQLKELGIWDEAFEPELWKEIILEPSGIYQPKDIILKMAL